MKRFKIVFLGRAAKRRWAIAFTILLFLLAVNITYFNIALRDWGYRNNTFQETNASMPNSSAQLAVIITGVHTGKQSISDYINLDRKLTFVISPTSQASEEMAKIISAYGCEVMLGLSDSECKKLQLEFDIVEEDEISADPGKHKVHDVFARFPQTQGLDIRPAGKSPYRRFVESMLPAVSVWGGYILIDDTWADIASKDISNSVACDYEIKASKGRNTINKLLQKAAVKARDSGRAVVVLDTSGCSSIEVSKQLARQFSAMEKQGIRLVLASEFAE